MAKDATFTKPAATAAQKPNPDQARNILSSLAYQAKKKYRDIVNQQPDKHEKHLLEMISDRLDEANEYRTRSSRGGLSLEAQWEQNGHRFLGNHWYGPRGSTNLVEGFQVFASEAEASGTKGIRRFTLNRTQSAIISNTAAQTEKPLSVRFEPQESNDPPEYLLTPDGGEMLAELIQAAQEKAQADQQAMAEFEAIAGDLPPEPMAVMNEEGEEETIMADAQPPAPQATPIDMELLEAGFLPEHLSGEEGDGPATLLTDSQAGLVMGLVDAGLMRESDLIEISDKTVRDVGQKVFDAIWNWSECDQQVLLNELYTRIFGHQPMRFEFNHKTLRFILTNDHILNCWIDPTHDTIDNADYFITEYALDLDLCKHKWPEKADALQRAAEKGQLNIKGRKRLGGASGNVDFKRPMVRVQVTWLRHQKVAMTDDEAVASGMVVTAESMFPDEDTEDLAEFYRVMNDDAEPIEPEPVEVDAKGWPTTTGILQVTSLPQINRKVDEQRCPYWDIPYGWNRNIPIPYSPYGQGDPVRLEDVQAQINLVLTILSNQIRYYQWPMRYWPQTLHNKLKAKGYSLHSRPGMEIAIPDRMYMVMASHGKATMVEEPATIPAFYTRYLEMLLAEHDRISGNVEVRQGVAPSTDMSGKALNALIAESRGPLAFASRFSEYSLSRIARLAITAMSDYMTLDQWGEIIEQYHPSALAKIVERLRYSQWDINVSITTGRGANQARDEERAISLRREGLLSKVTAMTQVQVPNPDKELSRIQEEEMALAAPPPGSPAPGPPRARGQ